MVQTIDIKRYPLGAGEIDISDTAGGPWTSLGATLDDTTFRVRKAMRSPDLNGVHGKIKGLNRYTDVAGELEVRVAELSPDRLALILPGSTQTVSPVTVTGTPAYAATNLAAPANPGDVNIKVASVTGAAIGQYIRIDVTAGGVAEYRQITAVGTLGAAGTGLTFADPLVRTHASGVAVTQTDGDGRTTVSGDDGFVIAESAYKFLRFRGPSLGGPIAFEIDNVLNTNDTADFVSGDDEDMAPQLTFEAHRDPLAPRKWPFRWILPNV